MLEMLARDLRFAARALRRSPAFTVAAVLTLALGIGATTAVFSVVYGIVLRPLPFPNADRLVRVVQVLPERPGQSPSIRAGLSPQQITEWRATSRTLAEIGYASPRSAVLISIGSPVRLNGAQVSVSLFRALGVPPWRGRVFVDEDEQPGNQHVLILSHDAWRGRFASSDDIIDRSIELNEVTYRVVGVMPAGFGFPSIARSMNIDANGRIADAPEFWIPIVAQPRPIGPATGGMTLVETYALLRPNVTLDEATAEVNTLMPARAGVRHPIELVNARVEEARTVRPILLLFQAAVLFVLFIACANVVNLLLARGASRRHELAVRRALGASVQELARYAVSEGVIVGGAGGAIGALLAYQSVTLFRTLPPFVLPRMADVRMDGMVLALAAAVSIGAGLLVGLAAALRTLRRDGAEGSMNWQRTSSAGRSHRPSRVLLAAEVAAGLVLLAGAALLLNSFVRLTSVDRGFDPSDVYTFRVSLPASYEPGVRRAFHEAFTGTLRGLPGVTSVGALAYMPGQSAIGFKTVVDGKQHMGPVAYNMIAPGVFNTFRIPLRGRDFNARDHHTETSATVIVSDSFARQFFPEVDPIGRSFDFQNWRGLEIIGVAADTRMSDVTDKLQPAVYVSRPPNGDAPAYAVRAEGAAALAAAVRATATRLDPNAVVFDATTMEARLGRTVASPRLYSATAVGFATVAVALAALGLYGVLAYSIGTRTREFGIRLALGATSRSVIAGVMRDAFAAVVPGVVLGLIGALYVSRFLEALLFGVRPGDPATFAAVAALFLVVAAVACYLPARRATRIDPVVALRAE